MPFAEKKERQDKQCDSNSYKSSSVKADSSSETTHCKPEVHHDRITSLFLHQYPGVLVKFHLFSVAEHRHGHSRCSRSIGDKL